MRIYPDAPALLVKAVQPRRVVDEDLAQERRITVDVAK
jgi:hypothetical protein